MSLKKIVRSSVAHCLVFVSVCALSSQAAAEEEKAENNNNETLLNIFSGGGRNTFVIAPELKRTTVMDIGVSMLGGRIGVLDSRRHFLGLAASTTHGERDNDRNDERLRSFTYGGLILGYETNNETLFQHSLTVMVGMGKASFNLYNGIKQSGDLFLIEPEIAPIVKVTSWMRAAVGLSWSSVWGLNVDRVSRRALDRWSLNFRIQFGNYDNTM